MRVMIVVPGPETMATLAKLRNLQAIKRSAFGKSSYSPQDNQTVDADRFSTRGDSKRQMTVRKTEMTRNGISYAPNGEPITD